MQRRASRSDKMPSGEWRHGLPIGASGELTCMALRKGGETAGGMLDDVR